MRLEDETTELKREYVDSIVKTVIAFANRNGGTIRIGVTDEGRVVGLEHPENDLLRAVNSIRDRIRPDVTLFVHPSIQVIEGCQVVVLEIQQGIARPYYLASKGIRPEGVFLRQGTSTSPASESAIVKMILETASDNYELRLALNQELTFDVTKASFTEAGLKWGDVQKRSLKLKTAEDQYTNLGKLLSDENEHSVKFAIFEGTTNTVFIDRKEFDGSLTRQLKEVSEVLERYNRVRSEIQGMKRIDHPDYPREAIRESLLNCLIHRDYGFSAPILISLFDDRLEFINIGGLVTGVSLADIKAGVSAHRNPNLAGVFLRLGYIEAYGSGIPKIMDLYDGSTAQPIIEVTDNAFKITLPNRNYQSNVKGIASFGQGEAADHWPGGYTYRRSKESYVMELLASRERLERKDVEAALGVSQATAVRILRSLTDDGMILREGKGKNSYYIKKK